MTANELIEAYVDDVVRQLARTQRNDVGVELRALLGEELQTQVEIAGRPADEAMALDLLRRFGRPADVAARYRTTGFAVIDPAEARTFVWTAAIGMLLVWSVSLFGLFTQGGGLNHIGAWWMTYGLGAFWWPGFLVVMMGTAAWMRRRFPMPDDWTPRAVDRDRINRAAWLAAIAFFTIGIVVMTSPVQTLEQLTGGRLPAEVYGHFAYDETFRRARLPLLLPLLVIQVLVYTVLVSYGRWKRGIRLADMTLSAVITIACVWVALAGPIFESAAADRIARITIWFVVVITLWDLAEKVRRERMRVRMPRSLQVCLLVAATALPSMAQTTPLFEKAPAPGRLIDIDNGRRLHILCKGDADGPTVIFEAGLSHYPPAMTYGKAQEAIAPFARVCIYDRAGLGWSDAGPSARTHADMVEDLHRLLTAANVPPPYVLVGHSMGGLLARQFVQAYRNDVAGVVLADATPDTIFDAESIAERAAIVAQIEKGLETAPASLAPEIWRTVKEEYEAIDRAPEALRVRDGYGRLGDIPLVVVRRGREATPPSDADLSWRRDQEHLATLSTNSLLVVAEKNGHVIPLENPGIIADAVKRVIDAWRHGSPLLSARDVPRVLPATHHGRPVLGAGANARFHNSRQPAIRSF